MTDHYKVEDFARGFIIVDYSGRRGKFGAAYTGKDMVWRDQPLVPADQVFTIEEATIKVYELRGMNNKKVG